MRSKCKISASLLVSLNEGGVLVASVSASAIDRYRWPEKPDLQPPFDGWVLVIHVQHTAVLAQLLRSLKSKFLFGPRQRWIVGISGCWKRDDALRSFDEGDKVAVVASESVETLKCGSHAPSKSFKMWSLHSVGNGSAFFQQDILNSEPEALFDASFTDFGGRTLRISSLGSPPIQEKPSPGTQKRRGYIFRIVNTLADIYNFTYVVKEAEDRLYGTLQEDGSWPGMIGELVNKSVDMGVGDLSWTLDRSVAVDLTETVFSETVTFIYRAPGFYSRTWILFQDIDFRVWISLTFAMILGSTVYCLTLCLSEDVENKEELFVGSAIKSTGAIYRALVGQSLVRHPEATSCRTVLGTWFVGTLILSALYGGSLTSTLSLHRSPRPADTLSELLKRYPNAVLAMRKNSQIQTYFQKSEVWRDVWKKNMQSHVIPGKLHIEELMEDVRRPRAPLYVWIAERSMLVKQMHSYTDDPSVCDLYVAKENIENSDWVLALSKNSPFLEQFNEKIRRMQQSGLLRKWHVDHWNSDPGVCRPSDGRNENGGRTPVSLADTQACFFVLGLGWALGLLLLAAERLSSKSEMQ